MDDDRRLSEEDARRLWRRATELQMEAARRLEAGTDEGVGGETGGEGGDDEGYPLEDVRAAAREAGIDVAYLDRALAELDAAGAVEDAGRAGALAERFLGDPPDVLVVSHTFEAPGQRVYEALRVVLPRPPFDLEVVESRGHLLEGGELILDVPSAWTDSDGGVLAYDVRMWADIREIHLTLRESAGGGRCEVTLACPLGRSKRINFWSSGGLSVFGALMGGLAGMSLLASASLPGLVLTVLAVAWTVGSPPALLYLGMQGSRSLYAYSLQKARKALTRLLDAVAVQAGLEGALGPTGFPPLSPGSRDIPDAGSEG